MGSSLLAGQFMDFFENKITLMREKMILAVLLVLRILRGRGRGTLSQLSGVQDNHSGWCSEIANKTKINSIPTNHRHGVCVGFFTACMIIFTGCTKHGREGRAGSGCLGSRFKYKQKWRPPTSLIRPSRNFFQLWGLQSCRLWISRFLRELVPLVSRLRWYDGYSKPLDSYLTEHNLCSMSVQNRSTTDNALVSQKGRCLINWFLQSTCFPWAMLSAALELASIAMRMTPNTLFL